MRDDELVRVLLRDGEDDRRAERQRVRELLPEELPVPPAALLAEERDGPHRHEP